MKNFKAKKERGMTIIEPTSKGLREKRKEKISKNSEDTLIELVDAVEKIVEKLGLDVTFTYRNNNKDQ